MRATSDNRMLTREMMLASEKARPWEPDPSLKDLPAIPGISTDVRMSHATTTTQQSVLWARTSGSILKILNTARGYVGIASTQCQLYGPQPTTSVYLRAARELIRIARELHAAQVRHCEPSATYSPTRVGTWRAVVDSKAGVLWRSARTYAHRQSAARAASTYLKHWMLSHQLEKVATHEQ